jgi:hypothetical protein
MIHITTPGDFSQTYVPAGADKSQVNGLNTSYPHTLLSVSEHLHQACMAETLVGQGFQNWHNR